MSVTLVYDGSFRGWLSCVFQVYERKLQQVSISKPNSIQADAFAKIIEVVADDSQSKRVWRGLSKKLSPEACNRIYSCYLSELSDVENLLLRFARHVFHNPKNIEEDYSNPDILAVAQLARKVWREKHRMEAFVRFQQLQDDMYYSGVEPDYNVLPLIAGHFKSRYADQHWLIYDIRRKYGIHYQPSVGFVSEVNFDWQERGAAIQPEQSVLSEKEQLYQILWKDYFVNTGIPSRKNLQLHIRHVPKRYWKYLTEKQL